MAAGVGKTLVDGRVPVDWEFMAVILALVAGARGYMYYISNVLTHILGTDLNRSRFNVVGNGCSGLESWHHKRRASRLPRQI
jgi:hypothetical protein